jgi:hypothetical protein
MRDRVPSTRDAWASTLVELGAEDPRLLVLENSMVVLDNGHFGETGMQQSHTGLGTDLVVVARGCGIEDAFLGSEPHRVRDVIERIGHAPVRRFDHSGENPTAVRRAEARSFGGCPLVPHRT